MSTSLQIQNSPIIQEESLIHELDTTIIPLREEEVLVPGLADKHPRDMPEMAFVIAFCIQYNEAVGNLSFLPEELEDAIMRLEPVDLVERVHRYFLRNVLNVPKIIDKRYWIKKLNQHLHERIENKEFVLSYNPLDRVNNVYHELSNYEKVMILKELVMWQFKGSEKVQTMWQFKESERIQSLSDLRNENIVRPVEVEVLGVDSKGSTYFYLGAGARVYREIPSADGIQQCTWQALTTTIQDLGDLISDRVEIDPSRSEEECLLYERISNELIPDIESMIEKDRIAEEEAIQKKIGKKSAKNNKSGVHYNKSSRKVPVEETESVSISEYENVQPSAEDEVTASGSEPILSVSMWSVTRPSTDLHPAQTVHDIKCFPTNQEENSSSVTSSDSNGIITSTSTINSASLWNDDDDIPTTGSSTHEKTNQNRRQNIKNAINNKRRMEEETSDDNYSSDFNDYMNYNKRTKFGQTSSDDDYYDDNDDDDDDDDYDDDDCDDDYDDYTMFGSYHDNNITKRSRKEKGKEVLRDEPYDNSRPHAKPKIDKGKSVIRYESSQENSNRRYNTSELSDGANREIFRPGQEDLIRLEWSLNHTFFEELEIFGEDSDSELSDCCDDCITEVYSSFED